MCGLAGIVGRIEGSDVATVCGMTEALRHRGPDAGGVETLDGAVLGHTRLRIIDLRPEADQPLTDEHKRFWLLFNGEIYNFPELRSRLEDAGHRFVSHSDTEVIVHLVEEHGEEFPQHLRGMFAIAVWDSVEQSLLLVRDRLGIKPLYYETRGSRLLFSSEAHTLPGAGHGLDEYALACYLHLGWVPGPRTAYRGIRELPPGHRLRWQAGTLRLERWWDPTHEARTVVGREVLAEALADAVRRHLVADVPVGIFLSSGLDSAVVATLTARVAADVTAYTVAFQEKPDETKGAKDLASRLGLRHEVVPISGTDVVVSIEEFIKDMDQPSVDGLNSWVVSRGVRARGAVVALSGVGGDELFAGYSTFRHIPRLTRLMSPTTWVPTALRAAPSVLLGLTSRSAHSRVRRVLDAARQPDQRALYAAVRGPMCPSEVERLRGGWGRDLRRRPPIVTSVESASVRTLELEHYLPNQLLRDTDAMSMAHSLEVRVPLLDDDVVAASAAHENSAGLQGKQLLAAVVDPELLPIAASPKETFTLPMDAWLRGPLHDWAGDMLHDLAHEGLGFDRRQLFDFFQDFQDGRAGWRGLWSMCVLGGWMCRRPGTASLGHGISR
jgi:asparagine synthase (glutamine-hydrolysing)